ncbi:MAG: phytanoyl-CoA dioxygenase family protein [Sciscionella sp.]
MTAPSNAATPPVWLAGGDCRLEDFRALVERSTDPRDYPHAECVEQNVPVYGPRLGGLCRAAEQRRAVQAELVRALLHGPGIVVCQGAFADTAVIDRATDAFAALIAEQHTSGGTSGDHFAKPGANDRVWNALEKLAVAEPSVFADYYANDVIALVCAAWLGPNYQMTSAVNVVNPGGAAQTPHRDYHLGFMPPGLAEQFPAHVHRLSPVLTLQGAVAQCDMPTESGPTQYLPYSQHYLPGYLAAPRPEFRGYFDAHRVQLPLAKGDAVFFNPALFHAAGHNRTADVKRMANLLQISSAFGRALEAVDRGRMCEALFPTLRQRAAAGAGERELRNIIAAAAQSYPFPTNLDREAPVGGLNPETQSELLWRALREGWDTADLVKALRAHARRHTTG